MSQRQSLLMSLFFYPRGGSAQVGRYLCRALRDMDWDVRLCTGSLGSGGEDTYAPAFYGDLNPDFVDYSGAARAFRDGIDPMTVMPPMHPSYEDRKGVPDRIFARVAPELVELQVDAWTRCYAQRPGKPAILHLHHLTPIHEAARRAWGNVPVVTHLHGTDLKMLRMIEDDPKLWPYGAWWREYMRETARQSTVIVTVSDHDRHEALALLPVDAERLSTIGNGVDTVAFKPVVRAPQERLAKWRNWLVEQPLGWTEGGEPGSIRYSDEDITAGFLAPDGTLKTVLLYVGRFTSFKRVDVLLHAMRLLADERPELPPVVIWGGFPDEWEGPHPHTLARELGLTNIFFIGWRGHNDLPAGLSCADVFVAPAVEEPFGQVYLEAMSCGLPVIATPTGGPKSFVNREIGRPNGWLAEPGDPVSLARTLREAIDDVEARNQRGANGRDFVLRNYSWTSKAADFRALYLDMTPAN